MKPLNVTLLIGLSAALEYHAVALYSILSGFIAPHFFAQSDPAKMFAYAFSFVTLGKFLQPVGSILCGLRGDLVGRKSFFSQILIIMAVVVLLMGIMPGVHHWGVAATILFVGGQLLLSILSGEASGAATILFEQLEIKNKGFYFGLMIAIMGLGTSWGFWLNGLLVKWLGTEAMVTWGFRIPYVLCGLAALWCVYLKRNLPETRQFLVSKRRGKRLTWLRLWCVRRIFIKTIGASGVSSCLSVFKLVCPVYLHNFYHYAWSDIYFGMAIGYTSSAFLFKPFFGWLADKIGKRRLIIYAVLVFGLGIIPTFAMLPSCERWVLWVFIALSHLTTSSIGGSYFALLPQAFATEIRATGTSISESITNILASLIALVANYAFLVAQKPFILVMVFEGLVFFCIYSLLTCPRWRDSHASH